MVSPVLMLGKAAKRHSRGSVRGLPEGSRCNCSLQNEAPIQCHGKPGGTMPLPEPADATFTVLSQETTQTGARRRRAWARLIDHLIAGERDADQDELRGLIARSAERPRCRLHLEHEGDRQALCGDAAPAATLGTGYRPSAATFETGEHEGSRAALHALIGGRLAGTP